MASEEVEAAPEAEAPAPEDTAAPSAAAALAPEDNAAQPAAAAPAPEAAAAPAAASPRGMRAGLESSVYHQGELPVRRVPLTATGAPTAASPPAVEPRVGSVLLGAPQLALPPGARTGGSGRVTLLSTQSEAEARRLASAKAADSEAFNTQAKPKKRRPKPKPKPPSPAVPHVNPKLGQGSLDKNSGPGPGTYHDGLAKGFGATKPSGTAAWPKCPSSQQPMRPPACSGRLPRPETGALAAWMPKSGCGNSLLLTQSLIPPPLTYQAAPLRCSGASSTRVTQTAHTARRSRQAPVRTMWCTRASAGRQGSGSWSKLTSQWRHSLPPRTPGTHGLRPLLLHALRKERCSLAHAPVA